MKKFDKYLFQNFFISFAGALVFLVGLFLISKILDNMKLFLDPNVTFNLIFSFLLFSIPESITLLVPVAAFISTSYTFGKLNISNEIIAIYNSGIGFSRIIRPFFISSLFLTFFSFVFYEFITVDSSFKAFSIRSHIKKSAGYKFHYRHDRRKFFTLGKDKTVYYIDYFDGVNKEMFEPVFFRFDENGNLVYYLEAGQGQYNEEKKSWLLRDISLMQKGENGKLNISKQERIELPLSESPEDIKKKAVRIVQMRLGDAMKFIDAKKKMGSDYKKYQVELHHRFAYPVSVIIMILIGSVVGIYFRKAALVLSFFVAVIISFGYYGLLALGIAFGKSGMLNPIAAAWIANIVYSIVAVVALKYKR